MARVISLPQGSDDVTIDLEGRLDHRSVEILLQVAESMTAADGVKPALNRLADLATQALNADRTAILVEEPLGSLRLIPAAASASDGMHAEMWRTFRDMSPIELPGNPHLLALWKTSGTVQLDDVARSPVVPDGWKRVWGSKSLAITCLRAGGEVYGILAIEFVKEHHAFTVHERRLLDAIAGAAGVALRSARLVEELQRAVVVERRLTECTRALRSESSLGEVLDMVAERFVSLLHDSSCSIYLLDADEETFRLHAYRGLAPAEEIRIEDLPQADLERVRHVWQGGSLFPIAIPDLRDHAAWLPLIPPGIDTGILLPLAEGERIIGFVAVGRRGNPFTDEELHVSSAFADHAAIAVSQTRQTNTRNLRLKVIEALFRLSDAVVRLTDLKAVLSAINKEVGSSLGVECVRLSFSDLALSAVLKLPPASEEDSEIVRRWTRERHDQPAVSGDMVGVSVRVDHRRAGILWVRVADPADPMAAELIRAIASGLGEVAYKAKLRKTMDRRSHELAIAEERERIARDLHDTVGQTLYGMGLKLQDVITELAEEGREDLVALVEPLRELAAGGVADVRSAVYALSFLHVRARGLIPSLRALARQFRKATGVPVELRIEGKLPTPSDEAESALYRTAHEALVNVDRHARATGVVLTLSASNREIELDIRDDGVGLDQRQVADWQSAAHFGMRMMAKSITEAGGTFRVTAAEPRGLIVRAAVPFGAARGAK